MKAKTKKIIKQAIGYSTGIIERIIALPFLWTVIILSYAFIAIRFCLHCTIFGYTTALVLRRKGLKKSEFMFVQNAINVLKEKPKNQ